VTLCIVLPGFTIFSNQNRRALGSSLSASIMPVEGGARPDHPISVISADRLILCPEMKEPRTPIKGLSNLDARLPLTPVQQFRREWLVARGRDTERRIPEMRPRGRRATCSRRHAQVRGSTYLAPPVLPIAGDAYQVSGNAGNE